MGHNGKRNAKMLRAITEIQRMRRSSSKALNEMKNKKGKDAEKTVREAVESLYQDGCIKNYVHVPRCSFMDCVRGTDEIVERLSDGMLVPIQIKSYFPSEAEKAKYNFLPVFIIVTPRDTDLKKIGETLLRKTNSWKGYFSYQNWQIRYSKFFDFKHYPEFGTMRRRKELFFADRKRKKEQIIFEQLKQQPNPN